MADASPHSAPPPRREGLSTGAKIAIGCAGLLGVGLVLVAVAVFAGGLFLKNRVSEMAGGMEEQQEASRIFRDLQREHAFHPPEDGVVGARRAERFLAVTDHAWEEMEGWARELEELDERMEGRERARASDVAAGFRSLGRLAESRLVLARALELEDMPPGEYIWTGLALTRALEELEGAAGQAGAPEENLALARRHRDELAVIARDGEGIDKGLVLGVAVMWGLADLGSWEAMGLDTLR